MLTEMFLYTFIYFCVTTCSGAIHSPTNDVCRLHLEKQCGSANICYYVMGLDLSHRNIIVIYLKWLVDFFLKEYN